MSWRMARNSILGDMRGRRSDGDVGVAEALARNVVTVSVSPGAGHGGRRAGGKTSRPSVGGSTTLTVAWTCSYVFYPPLPTDGDAPIQCRRKVALVHFGSKCEWRQHRYLDDKRDKWLERINLTTAPSLSNFPNPDSHHQFYSDGGWRTTKRLETGQVGLDSGIRVSITPVDGKPCRWA